MQNLSRWMKISNLLTWNELQDVLQELDQNLLTQLLSEGITYKSQTKCNKPNESIALMELQIDQIKASTHKKMTANSASSINMTTTTTKSHQNTPKNETHFKFAKEETTNNKRKRKKIYAHNYNEPITKKQKINDAK